MIECTRMRVLVSVLVIGVGCGNLRAQEVQPEPCRKDRGERFIGTAEDYSHKEFKICTNRLTHTEGRSYLLKLPRQDYYLGVDTIFEFTSETDITIEQGLVCLMYHRPEPGKNITISTPLGKLCIYGSIVWVQHVPKGELLDAEEQSTFATQTVEKAAVLMVDKEDKVDPDLQCPPDSTTGQHRLGSGEYFVLDSTKPPVLYTDLPQGMLGEWERMKYTIKFDGFNELVPPKFSCYIPDFVFRIERREPWSTRILAAIAQVRLGVLDTIPPLFTGAKETILLGLITPDAGKKK